MIEINSRNIRTWSMLGQNASIWNVAMPEILDKTNDVKVMTADLCRYSGMLRLSQQYKDKFINVGIAEQNMIGIAGGLSLEGNCVFATTYAPFITMRSMEQVRHLLGNLNLNIKAIGSAAGFTSGLSGNALTSIEDLAIMRAIPNMTVMTPADSTEAIKMILAVSRTKDPTYIRLSGSTNCPIVYYYDYEFTIGKSVMLEQGKNVAIITCGYITLEVLMAAKLLKERFGIFPTVINMHTIKPLDYDVLNEVFYEYSLIVTIEEHSVIGGLGSAVAEYKSKFVNVPKQLFIGIEDKFYRSGGHAYMLNECGLTAEKISKKIADNT